MDQSLSLELLDAQTENHRLEEISPQQLRDFYTADTDLHSYRPDPFAAVDPRTGLPVLYNTSRAARPHDNRPAAANALKACPVCAGKTTRVFDRYPLSAGETFINKNLYPMLYPQPGSGGLTSNGLHFLQWCSTGHHADWHNMPLADRVILLERLGRLEEKLLPLGHVTVIKNCGAPVGGSLVHGHQQISCSTVQPRMAQLNEAFLREHGESFPVRLGRENPEALTLRRGEVSRLVVPRFMRRPLQCMLLFRKGEAGPLSRWSDEQRRDAAEALGSVLAAYRTLMPRMGRTTAFNVVFHTAPEAGEPYLEFLPYTQETGGFEQAGLWVCQQSPQGAAEMMKEALDNE